jgi:hypothetical protein
MKYYFADWDEETCYPIENHQEYMEDNDIPEMKIFEAKMVTNEGYFYCTLYQETGEVSDGRCGKFCDGYKPRNGKNWRCRHSKNTYEPTDKFILLTNQIKQP